MQAPSPSTSGKPSGKRDLGLTVTYRGGIGNGEDGAATAVDTVGPVGRDKTVLRAKDDQVRDVSFGKGLHKRRFHNS